MRTLPLALFGVVLLFSAGFIRGGEGRSPDPELVWGAFYALGGLGLASVLAAGVTLGIILARD